MGPRAIYNRAAGGDIVSRALEEAGAEGVETAEWLMTDEKGDTYSPLAALNYVVYCLPTSFVRGRCNANGPWGVRLGPRARGSLFQLMWAPRHVPPATRKAAPREITQFLGNPLQIGYPAPMNADACLGCSVTGCQSWDVVYDHCDA